MHQPRIPEYYRDKRIFVTGATGFLGKVLVEKLLRSCPDVAKIYILVRSKKDKSPEQRWKEVTDNEIFDFLKSKRPGVFESGVVEVMEGDVSQIGLGLSDANYKTLQERVSIVFHVAATVMFNEPLPRAILMNVRGTREVVELALGMKDLEAFIHVSSAYCHCDKGFKSEEMFYPSVADWRKTIKIAEEINATDIIHLERKIIGKFPNTYMFTKNLAEDVIGDHMDQLPVVVLRPSVVSPKTEEPNCGWLDSINGPMYLPVFSSTGLLRTSYSHADCYLDYIAVNNAADGMIVAAWSKATRPKPENLYWESVDTLLLAFYAGFAVTGIQIRWKFLCFSSIRQYKTISFIDEKNPVYNQTCPRNRMPHYHMFDIIRRTIDFRPTKFMIWSIQESKKIFVDCELEYYLKAILYHVFPSIVLDQLLKKFGQKPMISRVQKKVRYSDSFKGYFSTTKWDFPNEKYISLGKQVQPEDEDDFHITYSFYNNYEILSENIWTYLKKLFLKDTEDNLEAYRRHRKMLNLINYVTTYSIRGITAWVCYNYLSSTNFFGCLQFD